jgi:hypothetical protein
MNIVLDIIALRSIEQSAWTMVEYKIAVRVLSSSRATDMKASYI